MLVAAAVVFVFYFRVVEAQTYKVVYKGLCICPSIYMFFGCADLRLLFSPGLFSFMQFYYCSCFFVAHHYIHRHTLS